ncbi:MAG: alpha/beta fold hydrolase [Cyanobacteria bacterium J06639_16]
MSLPTLLLVHGAWSGAWVWDQLTPALDALGISSLAIDLPGCSAGRPVGWGVSLNDYAESIIANANRIQGPVILVGHSAGGIAVSQAAAIAPQRFNGLIYVAAYLPINGESLAKLSKDGAGAVKSSVKPHIFGGTLTQTPAAIAALCYHDCSSEQTADLVHKHRPEPIRPGMAKVRLGPEFAQIRKHYVRCTQDRGLSPAFQRWMADRYAIDSFHELDTGHMPMIAAPSKLAEVFNQIIADLSSR